MRSGTIRLIGPLHATDATYHRRRGSSRHWLDYDPVALLVLIVGIGAVALVTLSI
jgi:hypothetical protein